MTIVNLSPNASNNMAMYEREVDFAGIIGELAENSTDNLATQVSFNKFGNYVVVADNASTPFALQENPSNCFKINENIGRNPNAMGANNIGLNLAIKKLKSQKVHILSWHKDKEEFLYMEWDCDSIMNGTESSWEQKFVIARFNSYPDLLKANHNLKSSEFDEVVEVFQNYKHGSIIIFEVDSEMINYTDTSIRKALKKRFRVTDDFKTTFYVRNRPIILNTIRPSAENIIAHHQYTLKLVDDGKGDWLVNNLNKNQKITNYYPILGSYGKTISKKEGDSFPERGGLAVEIFKLNKIAYPEDEFVLYHKRQLVTLKTFRKNAVYFDDFLPLDKREFTLLVCMNISSILKDDVKKKQFIAATLDKAKTQVQNVFYKIPSLFKVAGMTCRALVYTGTMGEGILRQKGATRSKQLLEEKTKQLDRVSALLHQKNSEMEKLKQDHDAVMAKNKTLQVSYTNISKKLGEAQDALLQVELLKVRAL